jgi:tryptophan-rich sensory protein
MFARVEAFAAWMLVPYLGWVTFATILNAAIVAMN